MPGRRRFNVDDNHSPSSPVRHRRRVDENWSNTAPRNADMPSKEEQERRDAQMALELQQEEEEQLIRERAQVIEPTLSPEALSLIINSPLPPAPARHLGTRRRNASNTRQQSRLRHNRTRSESPRNPRNNIVVLMLNSGDCLNMQSVADTLIEIGTRMQAANGQEFNIRANAIQSVASHGIEEIESDESADLEESVDTHYSSKEMSDLESFAGHFESDRFEDSSNGSLASEDPSMYSEEHESGLTDSEESDVHLNDSMDDLESENDLSTSDKSDDEEDSTQSSNSEDCNDENEISDSELSDNSSEYDFAIYGESSINDARVEFGPCDSDDMYDGELTLGDDSEIDTDDSEDGDDEDENESIASSDDASEDHSIEEERAGSTTEEDESDDGDESGDDNISSLSSGSSMDGPRRAHLVFGQLLNIGDLLVANERRERRERRDTTPLEPPDETVIQCSDWGQCTICFEEAPYDPVGCLHCQQLIGCKQCVNRWFRGGGRQRADSPLSLGLSGVNHRQCPLCRHEYEAPTPEVGSMFELAPKH